jgi:hypothetical protein
MNPCLLRLNKPGPETTRFHRAVAAKVSPHTGSKRENKGTATDGKNGEITSSNGGREQPPNPFLLSETPLDRIRGPLSLFLSPVPQSASDSRVRKSNRHVWTEDEVGTGVGNVGAGAVYMHARAPRREGEASPQRVPWLARVQVSNASLSLPRK